MPKTIEEIDGKKIEAIIPDSVISTRNGIEWPCEASSTRKLEKDSPDRFALKPIKPKDEEGKQKFLAWIGLDQVLELAYQKVAQTSVNITKSSIDEKQTDPTKAFSVKDFLDGLANFSARGETMASLREELSNLQEEFKNIILSGTITDPEAQKAKFKEIAERIKYCQEQLILKQKTKEEEPEKPTPTTAAGVKVLA